MRSDMLFFRTLLEGIRGHFGKFCTDGDSCHFYCELPTQHIRRHQTRAFLLRRRQFGELLLERSFIHIMGSEPIFKA